jgi:hypothetical protein
MSTITTRAAKGTPLTNNEMDTNLTNLNTDKYESGNDIVVDDISSTGNLILSIAATVTAAGSTQAGATALTKTYSMVTTATSNQGVKLPTAQAGSVYNVINATGVNVKIYPNTSGTINDGSANVAVNVPAGASIEFIGSSTTNWQTLVDIVIYDSTGTRLN